MKEIIDGIRNALADFYKIISKDTEKTIKSIDEVSSKIDVIPKAIQTQTEIQSQLNNSIQATTKAIEDKEVSTDVAITNPEEVTRDLKKGLEDIVETLKSEIKSLDKEVIIKNDLSQLAALFKDNKDKKDFINALNIIGKKIDAIQFPDFSKLNDYTQSLLDIASLIKSKSFQNIEQILEEIRDKETSSEILAKTEPRLLDKNRLKVILPEGQVAQMSQLLAQPGGGSGNTLPTGASTEAKQNDLITALGKSFNTNEILEDGTDTYFCKETKAGVWWLMKIDTNSVFTHATNLNNGAVNSYADARSGYAGLTYQTYNLAFD